MTPDFPSIRSTDQCKDQSETETSPTGVAPRAGRWTQRNGNGSGNCWPKGSGGCWPAIGYEAAGAMTESRTISASVGGHPPVEHSIGVHPGPGYRAEIKPEPHSSAIEIRTETASVSESLACEGASGGPARANPDCPCRTKA